MSIFLQNGELDTTLELEDNKNLITKIEFGFSYSIYAIAFLHGKGFFKSIEL